MYLRVINKTHLAITLCVITLLLFSLSAKALYDSWLAISSKHIIASENYASKVNEYIDQVLSAHQVIEQTASDIPANAVAKLVNNLATMAPHTRWYFLPVTSVNTTNKKISWQVISNDSEVLALEFNSVMDYWGAEEKHRLTVQVPLTTNGIMAVNGHSVPLDYGIVSQAFIDQQMMPDNAIAIPLKEVNYWLIILSDSNAVARINTGIIIKYALILVLLIMLACASYVAYRHYYVKPFKHHMLDKYKANKMIHSNQATITSLKSFVASKENATTIEVAEKNIQRHFYTIVNERLVLYANALQSPHENNIVTHQQSLNDICFKLTHIESADLHEIMQPLMAYANSHDTNLSIKCDEAITVRGDMFVIQLMVTNIMAHALAAVGSDKHVVIRISSQPQHVSLECRFNGLFAPVGHAHAKLLESLGCPISLSMEQLNQLAEQQGGSFMITSSFGAGTNIVLAMPLGDILQQPDTLMSHG